MVEVGTGFKMGVVKFIGETEFAGGEWIGVALDRPSGEYSKILPLLSPLHCASFFGLALFRQTQRDSQRSEVLQVQGETQSFCQSRQDHS